MVEVDQQVGEPHSRAEVIQHVAKPVPKLGAEWDDRHGGGVCMVERMGKTEKGQREY